VNCIHWVKKDDLPALEYVMQNRVERVNVGVMMAGQGRVADVFDATMSFMKERKRKEEAQLRAKRAYSPAQEEARRYALVAFWLVACRNVHVCVCMFVGCVGGADEGKEGLQPCPGGGTQVGMVVELIGHAEIYTCGRSVGGLVKALHVGVHGRALPLDLPVHL
jgi:hypothetical protein